MRWFFRIGIVNLSVSKPIHTMTNTFEDLVGQVITQAEIPVLLSKIRRFI